MNADWVTYFNTSLVPIGLMLIMFSLGLTLALRDFALAVILTALTSLVTVFSIPLLLSWAVPWFLGHGGGDLPPDFLSRTIMQLVRITVLPMVAGMVVRHFAPGAAAKMARWLKPTAFVILVTVIVVAVVASLERVLENLLIAAPAILVLNLCAMGLGLLIAQLLGANARDSMTLSIETGVQNVTLALVITLSVLGDLSVAVTQNIYGVIMILNASLLIRWWRRRIAAEPATTAAE